MCLSVGNHSDKFQNLFASCSAEKEDLRSRHSPSSGNAARARDLSVSPLGLYYVGEPRLRGLVIGFANTPVALAGDAVKRLAAAVRV